MSLGKMKLYMPEDEQMQIGYTFKNYKMMPERFQKEAKELCEQVAPYNSEELLKLLITDNSVAISMEYHVSVSNLLRLRAKFFKKVADNGGLKSFTMYSG